MTNDDRQHEPRALIPNVRDNVVNKEITNQHYSVKNNKMVNIIKVNRGKLRQLSKINKNNRERQRGTQDVNKYFGKINKLFPY